MNPQYGLGVLSALVGAVVWGGGDWSGGVATKRGNPFQVQVLATLAGLDLLIICALVAGETWSSWASIGWAALAGLAGSLGLMALYRGLAVGAAVTVAPTAAVVSAALPVIFTVATGALPPAGQAVGFALALLGIWLVSGATGGVVRAGSGLALLAGVGFGSFFILLHQIVEPLVFVPLVVSRVIMLALTAGLLLANRAGFPAARRQPLALLAGLLDAGGNVFFVLAASRTTLAVAAVLASLYPVSTMLLARLLQGERASARQWLGAALCLVAAVLIALFGRA